MAAIGIALNYAICFVAIKGASLDGKPRPSRSAAGLDCTPTCDRPLCRRRAPADRGGPDLIAQDYGSLGLLALTLTLLIAAAIAARQGRGPAVDPFESGARTEHKTWVQYRVRYAVLSLLFVSFDMEMVFMFPWAVVFRRIGLVAFLDMFLFVAILAAALAYAWKEGVFDWED